jgi:hypothetical protein
MTVIPEAACGMTDYFDFAHDAFSDAKDVMRAPEPLWPKTLSRSRSQSRQIVGSKLGNATEYCEALAS